MLKSSAIALKQRGRKVNDALARSPKALIAKVAIAILLPWVTKVNGASATDPKFSHYLKFFQVRFGYKVPMGTPLPKGLVEFTLGDAYENLDQYIYVSFTSIHGHIKIGYKAALQYATVLTREEIIKLFDGKKAITKDKLQKADIEKIHRELTVSKPPLFPHGKELTYGVKLDNYSNVILDTNKRALPDTELLNYQLGKTIVIPSTYNSKQSTRFFFNLNNPSVREYLVRYALTRLTHCRDNALFIDNVIVSGEQVKLGKTDLHYISAGWWKPQAELYSEQLIGILKEIKQRANPKIIVNGYRDNHSQAKILYDKITDPANFDCVDGLMIEDRFYLDKTYAEWCTNVEFYLDVISKAKKHKKIILFTVRSPQASEYQSLFVYNVWLWLHLVANDNVYVYINDDFTQPMRDFSVYSLPLGRPLERPKKDGNIWTRKYQRGTVLFDTRSKKLRDIRFEPEHISPQVTKVDNSTPGSNNPNVRNDKEKHKAVK